MPLAFFFLSTFHLNARAPLLHAIFLGEISFAELCMGMGMLGIEAGEDEMMLLFSSLDTDCDAEIKIAELEKVTWRAPLFSPPLPHPPRAFFASLTTLV